MIEMKKHMFTTNTFRHYYDQMDMEEQVKVVADLQDLIDQLKEASPLDRGTIIHDYIDELTPTELNPAERSPCRDKCTFCCHFHVDASMDEVDLILDYCKENKITFSMKKLREQTKYGLNTWRGDPCVFLKDGSCSIYPVRPSTCRSYYHGGPDNSDCEKGVLNLQGKGEPIESPRLASWKIEFLTVALWNVYPPDRKNVGTLPRLIMDRIKSNKKENRKRKKK